MTSTRIKGNKLSLTIGGVDYWADHTKYELDNEEASEGVVTFADAQNGGSRLYFLALSAIQSLDSASFWRMIWAHAGEVVAYRLAPFGNAVATADQPHFTGTLKIGQKPKVGGEASTDGEFEFDTRFDCQEVPTLDVGATAAAVITSITPAGKSAGDLLTISGTRFTGATDVKFAATSATKIVVVSDTTIIAQIPAGTGAKSVTVVTPAGTSAGVSYTVV